MPLFLFEGLSGTLITAVRPTGRENAAIVGGVRLVRQAWPHNHIVLRGDGHFVNPERMTLCEQAEQLDFNFGLAGSQILLRKAALLLNNARAWRQNRLDNARRMGAAAPGAARLYDDLDYKARSWAKNYRVVLKAR